MNRPFDIVCHLSSKMDWRGGEQQLLYLCEELKASGVPQVIMTPDNSILSTKVCTDELLCIKKYRHHVQKPLTILSLSLAILRILRKQLHIILHVHDSDAHTAAFLAALLYRRPAKIVVSRRVDFPIGKTWFSKYKYNHKSVQCIICVSTEVERITCQALKNKHVTKVIHDGINIERFSQVDKGFFQREYSLEPDVKVIGNVAALAPHKDYFTFIDTAKQIYNHQPKVHFFIVGDGPLYEKIKEYVELRGMADVITLCGFLSPIEPVIKGLDLFLFTSSTEGLGSSILDAYSAEIPVVCTTAGGIPDIAINGFNAATSAPGSPKELANQAITILRNQELRQQLIDNAKSFVKRFSKEEMARKTLSCYLNI